MKFLKIMVLIWAVILISVAIFGCGYRCPTKEEMKTLIATILPVNLEVVEVAPLKEISGLCEVVVRTNEIPVIFYTDKKGAYVISGSIVEMQTKRNLTSLTQKKYAPLAPVLPPALPQQKKPSKKPTAK